MKRSRQRTDCWDTVQYFHSLSSPIKGEEKVLTICRVGNSVMHKKHSLGEGMGNEAGKR